MPLRGVVGGPGFEPGTSPVWGERSSPELPASILFRKEAHDLPHPWFPLLSELRTVDLSDDLPHAVEGPLGRPVAPEGLLVEVDPVRDAIPVLEVIHDEIEREPDAVDEGENSPDDALAVLSSTCDDELWPLASVSVP